MRVLSIEFIVMISGNFCIIIMPLSLSLTHTHTQKSGIAIVSDVEREKTMVQELLELKAKVDGIIENAFKGSPLFVGVVREGFEAVVNRRQNKPAELIGVCVCVCVCVSVFVCGKSTVLQYEDSK